jgi:hypothetical protein
VPRKNGKALQRVVRILEAARAAGQPITVESPKYLMDRVTGEPREHDVVLSVKLPDRSLTVAIECRDRSRKIDCGAVEAFRKKCDDTKVDRGIIVCPKGFYKTALKKAKHENIDCLSIEAAASFDWCAARSILVHHQAIEHVHLLIDFSPDEYPEPKRDAVFHMDGRPITPGEINAMASNTLPNAKGIPERPGSHVVRLIDKNPQFCTFVDGRQVKAERATLTVAYTVTETDEPFAFHSYKDIAGSKSITNAAVANLKFGQHATNLVLASQADGSVSVSLVPHLEKETT